MTYEISKVLTDNTDLINEVMYLGGPNPHVDFPVLPLRAPATIRRIHYTHVQADRIHTPHWEEGPEADANPTPQVEFEPQLAIGLSGPEKGRDLILGIKFAPFSLSRRHLPDRQSILPRIPGLLVPDEIEIGYGSDLMIDLDHQMKAAGSLGGPEENGLWGDIGAQVLRHFIAALPSTAVEREAWGDRGRNLG